MSTHTAYFSRTPRPQKQEMPEKRDDDVIIMFFQVFLVFRVEGFIKSMHCGYSLDVESNSTSNPIKIWVKTQRDMSKIWTKKVVFSYDKYVNSTIMVDSFYWNSIGSWIPTHKNLLLARFLIRPILYPKFPLMLGGAGFFMNLVSWVRKSIKQSKGELS